MENLVSATSMVPYLPFEVMTQILEKLPVRTLLRFRVVCKLWCSLISSDQFVKRHLSLSASNTQRIIMNPYGSLYDLGFYSVNDTIVLHETSIDIRIGSHTSFSVMGSCNGLICLKGVTGTTLLWNPSTRELKMLPSTSEIGGQQINEYWRYGFGYDYNSDDYKVLLLIPNRAIFSDNVFGVSYNSLMYTLRSNSWRRIQDSPFGIHIVCPHAPSAFANGALHWNAAKIGWIGAIVSFDLTSETFKEVPLPISGCQSYQLEVGASRGCLCLCLLTDEDVDGGSYGIWVMKEYGVQESWTKTVEIPSYLEYITLKPMAWFEENGEILLNANGNLLSYNADKNSLVHFPRDDKIRSMYTNRMGVGYVESLVSPNAYNNLGANEAYLLDVKIVQRMVAYYSYRSRNFVQIDSNGRLALTAVVVSKILRTGHHRCR